MFITNNHASFNLKKRSKYYVHDYLQNFILLFMFLLTAPIVKNSHFGWNLLYLSKKRPGPNLKAFRYQIWTSMRRMLK